MGIFFSSISLHFHPTSRDLQVLGGGTSGTSLHFKAHGWDVNMCVQRVLIPCLACLRESFPLWFDDGTRPLMYLWQAGQDAPTPMTDGAVAAASRHPFQ